MTKSLDFVNEKRNFRLGNSADNDGRKVILRELGTADVESIESVRAICAVLQEVFLRFRQFLSSLVFAETVPATRNACRLECQDKIFIVLPVDERHQSPATCKGFVYLQILLVVFHRVADIDILHAPAVSLKLVDNHPTKILLIDGIVRAKGGGVVVENNRLVLMGLVVRAKVGNERRDFPLELGIKGLDYIQPFPYRLTGLVPSCRPRSVVHLPCDYPVDVGVVVHTDVERHIRDNIAVLLRVRQQGRAD